MKYCLLLFLILALGLAPGKPDWVAGDGNSPRFPGDEYLTGFESAKRGNDQLQADAMRLAVDNARRTLIEKIRVTIQSRVLTKLEEKNKQYSSYVSAITEAAASLEIQGLQSETYYDDREKMCYAFAYVKRDDLAGMYSKKANECRAEIGRHFQQGQEYETSGNPPLAIKEYLACYPLFHSLEEAEAILAVINKGRVVTPDELDTTAKKGEVDLNRLSFAVSHLIQKPMNSLEDLAWYLSYTLGEKISSKQIVAIVSPPTYQTTVIATPFSLYFKQTLETRLSESNGWKIVEQTVGGAPQTGDISREFAAASGAEYLLSGTYWPKGDSMKFFVSVRRVTTNEIEASAEAFVPLAIVKSANQDFIPANYEQAVTELKEFRTKEIVNDGLRVDVWTNKGKDGVVFTEGELMEVSLRVNQPCHVRFIYHQADGKRVLLLNDYFLSDDMTNTEYKIPTKFLCGPPFGAEFLQVIAQTGERFPGLATTKIDKYEYLTEDLKTLLPRLRGRTTEPQPGGTQALRAEQRVQISTLPKQ